VSYDRIWAPWRLRYILGEDEEEPGKDALDYMDGADPECFLCQACADSSNPRRHVVKRGELWIAILNHYPYNNGHLLIAPCQHKARFDQLTSGEHQQVSQAVAAMVGLLEKVMRPEGFNIGLNLGRVAGAGLPGHLHWHIVPRWNGDTNFMASLAAVRVIPQSLDALWEALRHEVVD
jgi:ATP adenylyltransferase